MRKTTIGILVFLIPVSIASAYYFGRSNLTFGYPDCNCYPPNKPYQFSSDYEVDRFRNEVNDYIDCVNSYLEAAENDIEQISDAMDDARNEANWFIDSL